MYKCWSLYNKEEQLRVDELSIDQVRVILLSIPAKKLRGWYALKEGDPHWTCITDIPEFYEDTRQPRGKDYLPLEEDQTSPRQIAAKPSKSAAQRRPLFEDPPDAETASTMKIQTAKTKERRTARRYVRNLKFIITEKGAPAFESLTEDVSMGGFSLIDPLPAKLPKRFRGRLSLKNDKVEILCTQVTDLQVKLLEADAWDLLRHWLISW